MRKLKRNGPVVRGARPAGALAAGAAAVLLAGCASLPLAEPTGAPSAAIQGYRDEASRLRGLPVTREIAVEEESAAELLASLEKELDKAENLAFMNATELLLRQFRILQPDVALRSVYLRLMSQQVAAYYDPEKKRLAYVDENVAATAGKAGPVLPGMRRFVYVHEFCHALEDAHFDLDRLTKASLCELDRNLALTSFAEGNAVLTGVDGLLDGYGLAVNTATPLNAWLVSHLGGVDLEEAAEDLEGTPPFLAGALLRPYLDGAVFSNRIRRDAGWQGIDAVYRTGVPLTTAEILYPERRYLKGFRAAVFEPDARLFRAAGQGVATNSLGVMATALWLGGDEPAAASRFGFLKGWLGDRVYLINGPGAAVQTVWLSAWERPGMARAFRRRVERRLKSRFGDVAWSVRREGRLVAAVWDASGTADRAACDAQAECALKTRVEARAPSLLASWSQDLPWPVRFPHVEGHSSGCEVLGGYAADVRGGPAFFRLSLAGGVLLTAETNPDRHYYGTLWGALRHVSDARSDFTYWKLPVLASWHRRGQGDGEQYRWRLLWGLLADGTERRARVLFVPVWRRE